MQGCDGSRKYLQHISPSCVILILNACHVDRLAVRADCRRPSLRNFFRYDVASNKIKPCANASEAIEAMESFTKLSFFDDIEQNGASYDIHHILKNADDEPKLPSVDVANC